MADEDGIHIHCLTCYANNCQKFKRCPVIVCRNNCGVFFHECKQAEHQTVCRKQPRSCTNSSNGCLFTGDSVSLMNHLQICPAMVAKNGLTWNQTPSNSKETWKPLCPTPSVPVNTELEITDQMSFDTKMDERTVEAKMKTEMPDEDIHLHCFTCCTNNCQKFKRCPVILCRNHCGVLFHQCKQTEHLIVCSKQPRPCINSLNGCMFTGDSVSLVNHLQICPAMVVEKRFKWNKTLSNSKESWMPIFPTPGLPVNTEIETTDEMSLSKKMDERTVKDYQKVISNIENVMCEKCGENYADISDGRYCTKCLGSLAKENKEMEARKTNIDNLPCQKFGCDRLAIYPAILCHACQVEILQTDKKKTKEENNLDSKDRCLVS